MQLTLGIVGTLFILVGLAGAVIPLLPGIPLIFAGVWLIAGADHYQHVSSGWLMGIACVGVLGVMLDLLAAALGAKRVGASPRAVWGALLGTLIGLFFGLPGLVFGPFVGALAGELLAGQSMQRSTRVGINTWIGLIFGTVAKLVTSIIMVVLFAFAWWLNRGSSGN